MPTWTPENAQCNVYAFKEGLLSAAGHDVKLRVTDFEVVADRRGVRGTFDPASLQVVCAMAAGEEAPDALSDGDKATIEGYVVDDILQVDEHPEITWESTRLARSGDGSIRVEGRLSLHGRTKPVKATVRTEGGQLVTRVKVRQPEFGITPFRALLGALKIKAVVEVELVVPATDTEALGQDA
ncbi:MAG: YceI family protein [Myxococcales bacterium]|nr:YceI family protein [Myxococcales bacterium]